jgi:hypothetical protein
MDNQNYIVLRNSKKDDAYSAAHDLDNKVDDLQAKLDDKDMYIQTLEEQIQTLKINDPALRRYAKNKDEELESLRGYAKCAHKIFMDAPYGIMGAQSFKNRMIEYGLMDFKGNPTNLLTGDK